MQRASTRGIRGLAGAVTALVTPFRQDAIDEDAFVGLCRRQIESGIAALVPCGTTGEASTLTRQEQIELFALAIGAAEGRVPVIAGAGSNCTRTAVTLTNQAELLGADAVLSVVPYYNRPSQEGLYQHFRTIMANSSIPVLLYDVPSRTGCPLAIETVARLAELPNFAGIKDAGGDPERARKLRRLMPDGSLLFCGDDQRATDWLGLGADGTISVASNLIPASLSVLHRDWRAGRRQGLGILSGNLAILAEALFLETNPIPVKWALSHLGLIEDEIRLPLTRLAPEHHSRLIYALNAVMEREAMEAARMTDPVRAHA